VFLSGMTMRSAPIFVSCECLGDTLRADAARLCRYSAFLLAVVCLFVRLVAPGAALASDVAEGEQSQRPELVFSTFPSEGMGELFGRILTEAYDRIGFDVVIRRYPAARALVMANEGSVDGEAGRGAVIEEDNRNLVRVPTPLYMNRIVAFSRQPYLNTSRGWDSLAGYKLGVVTGYRFVEKMTRQFDCDDFNSYSALFTALDNDRIDVAVSEYLEALPTVSKLRLDRVGAHAPPLALNPMYHYLHKEKAWMIPDIDASLRAMRESGRMDEILKGLEEEYKRQ